MKAVRFLLIGVVLSSMSLLQSCDDSWKGFQQRDNTIVYQEKVQVEGKNFYVTVVYVPGDVIVDTKCPKDFKDGKRGMLKKQWVERQERVRKFQEQNSVDILEDLDLN